MLWGLFGSCKKNPQGIAVVALVNKQIAKVSADMASIYAYITTLALDKKHFLMLLNGTESLGRFFMN